MTQNKEVKEKRKTEMNNARMKENRRPQSIVDLVGLVELTEWKEATHTIQTVHLQGAVHTADPDSPSTDRYTHTHEPVSRGKHFGGTLLCRSHTPVWW